MPVHLLEFLPLFPHFGEEMKKIFCLTFSITAAFSCDSYAALLKVSCQFENIPSMNGFNLVSSIHSEDSPLQTQALVSIIDKGENSQESDPELISLAGVQYQQVEKMDPPGHAYLVLHLIPQDKNTVITELFLQVGTHRPNASLLQTKNKKIYRSNCREIL